MEKDGNDSLSIDYKEEIKVIFHKSTDLLISSTLNSINLELLNCIIVPFHGRGIHNY